MNRDQLPAGRAHPTFGRHVMTFPGSVAAGGWFWYVGAIVLVAAVVQIAQAASPGLVSKASPGGSVAMGLAGLAAGVALLAIPVLRWRQSVEVYERGFVWRGLLGASPVSGADIVRSQDRQAHRQSRQLRRGRSDSCPVAARALDRGGAAGRGARTDDPTRQGRGAQLTRGLAGTGRPSMPHAADSRTKRVFSAATEK